MTTYNMSTKLAVGSIPTAKNLASDINNYIKTNFARTVLIQTTTQDGVTYLTVDDSTLTAGQKTQLATYISTW